MKKFTVIGVSIAAFIFAGLFSATSMSQAATSDPTSKQASDEQIGAQILEEAEKLRKEARKGDTALFDGMIDEGYAEFDPFFPFLLDPPKSTHVELEKYWDAFDKLPASDKSHKIQKIQVYGNVALLTSTAISKGTHVGPGFMSQAKFLSVYEKRNGRWILVYTHDGRRTGPDGLPID